MISSGNQNQGRGPAALREFEAILNKNDGFVGEAGLRAAQLYVEMDSRDRAMEALTKASRDTNVNEAALETVRGRIQLAEGNDAGAREAFRKAVSADPLYAPAHLESGLWYVRRQVINEGIRELEQYLALVDPNDPKARALEVQALVSQLEQSMSGDAATPGVRAGETRREP